MSVAHNSAENPRLRVQPRSLLLCPPAVFFQMRSAEEYISLTNIFGTPVLSFFLAFMQASPQSLLDQLGIGSFVKTNHLYENITSFDPAVLHDAFGITNGLPFTYIVQPMIAVEFVNSFLPSLGVEDNQTHVLINPIPSSRDAAVCDGILDPYKSKTPDCLARTPIRRDGDRRYNTMFGTISNPSPVPQAALDYMHILGANSVVTLVTAVDPTTTLTDYQLQYVIEAAPTFNINVLLTVRLENYQQTCRPTLDPYPSTCPPLKYLNVTIGSQTQNWPAHQSALDIAKQIAAANPDALMILGQPSSPGTWAMSELFNQFHVIGWTPKAVWINGFNPTSESSNLVHTLAGFRPFVRSH
jgi:hypothetical protein